MKNSNVGIGTTAPTTLLDVAGAINITAEGPGNVEIYGGTGGNFNIYNFGTGGLLLGAGGNYGLYI